jgi:diguanylate cyclase (GGDEF)-like protein
MHFNFSALPALIALVILVGVFAAISRQPTRERVRLWLIGWALILVRSLVQFVHSGPAGHWTSLDLAIALSTLELASIAFLVSVAPKADTGKRQTLLATAIGVPALVYTNAMIFGIEADSFYYVVIALGLVALLLVVWSWYKRISLYVVAISTAALLAATLLMWGIARGKDDIGVHSLLAALNITAGGLYWYRFRRISAGVLTTVIGFLTWGATFPAGLLMRIHFPSVHVESEIFNIPIYLVAVGMIVTLLEDQIRESEHLAYHDALTGLPNRRLLQDRLTQALAHADRAGHKVAVLLMDLDDFKEVNDTFGHRVGDATLQQVVLRLSTRMRASDTLARTGGDEFTVVSEITDALGAQTLVAALESGLLLPFKVEGHLVQTGVSIGFALYPDDAEDPDDLCAAADKAMYASKRGSPQLRSAGRGSD